MADNNQMPIPLLQLESPDNHLWDEFDWRHACFVLLMITLAMYGDVLFSNSDRVLSASGLDLYSGELSGLDSSYRALRKGVFIPWNAHVFSGAFSLGTALYPPNFLIFMLPLPQVVNVGIALHVFLAGFFMYLWAARRRLHPLACLTVAVILMFSGPFFMHVFAGHVGNLCAMTWAPLILVAVDGMAERPSFKWALLGIFAVTMQILASQFQYVYYTALTAVIYSLVRLPAIEHRRTIILGLFSIPAGGFLLSAFHLLPSIAAAGEGVRSTGVAVSFAAMFSFPPENFLTLIAPFFFGNIQEFPYWGRCYLWEMCLFTGVIGFFLAVFGAVQGQIRRRCELPAMIVVLLILALGAHTPMFRLLFDWLPGFDKFRGTSKFMFFASLFWIMLAGYGCDAAIRKRISWPIFTIPLVAAALLGGLAIWLYNTPLLGAEGAAGGPSLWNALVSLVAGSRESYLPAELYKNPNFLHDARQFAATGLLAASGTAFIVAGLSYLRRSSPRVVYILVLLAIVEMFVFGRLNRPTFSYQELGISQLKSFYAAHPGDYRVLSFVNPNTAMSTGAQDIWGYGPVAMDRYVQFMAWTQGVDPDRATTYLKIQQYHPLFKMLRLRYVFTPDEKG
ncbi:MAG TPA: YfhO family protein, partial [Syntrophales bacterium]|nr:YfhO family protein [Syntrophales bacterium]